MFYNSECSISGCFVETISFCYININSVITSHIQITSRNNNLIIITNSIIFTINCNGNVSWLCLSIISLNSDFYIIFNHSRTNTNIDCGSVFINYIECCLFFGCVIVVIITIIVYINTMLANFNSINN